MMGGRAAMTGGGSSTTGGGSSKTTSTTTGGGSSKTTSTTVGSSPSSENEKWKINYLSSNFPWFDLKSFSLCYCMFNLQLINLPASSIDLKVLCWVVFLWRFKASLSLYCSMHSMQKLGWSAKTCTSNGVNAMWRAPQTLHVYVALGGRRIFFSMGATVK